MLPLLIRRLAPTIPVMMVVALVVFGLLRLTPGDPAAVIAGDYATPDDVVKIRATDTAKRKQIGDRVQTLAYDEVPYVPWGQFTQPTAYRKNVKGVLTFPASLYWNVAVD